MKIRIKAGRTWRVGNRNAHVLNIELLLKPLKRFADTLISIYDILYS